MISGNILNNNSEMERRNSVDLEELENLAQSQEARKLSDEMESSALLIKQLLESDGVDPQEIEKVMEKVQQDLIQEQENDIELQKYYLENIQSGYKGEFEVPGDDYKIDPSISYAPPNNEEEIKVDYDILPSYQLEQVIKDDMPEATKNLIEELILAEQNEYILRSKQEEANINYIDKIVAEELQEKEKKTVEEEKASEAYIKSLMKQQEEEEEEKEAQVTCPICLDPLFSKTVFPLHNCGHLFHIECLEEFVIEEIKKRTFPIKCPNPDCKKEIPEDDIKDTLQAHIEYQDIYDEYYIKSYVDSNPDQFYHCPTPDCKFVCSVETEQFNCPECNKSYCTKCKTDWHNKLTCAEYQQLKKDQGDDVFIKFANKMKFKRCPKCKVYVERTEGCNAMTCTRCQTMFCYQCGKQGDGHLCNHKK